MKSNFPGANFMIFVNRVSDVGIVNIVKRASTSNVIVIVISVKRVCNGNILCN
jgi:hypothetical protein